MEIKEIILNLLDTLKVADSQTIGDVIVARNLADWSSGHSARTNAQKHLNALADLKNITKHNGFYRSLNSSSEYSDHARLLTQHLSTILKSNNNSVIFREHTLPNGLRADTIFLLRNGNRCFCGILEVCHTETYDYLKGKYDEWKRWKEAKPYLTQLFKVNIPHFCMVVEGKEVGFAKSLKEVLKCG
jgi:hypothetical protein